MSALRGFIGRRLQGHVLAGSEKKLNGFTNPFAPRWSPFEGLDTNAIHDWGALVWHSTNIGDETQAIAEVGLYPTGKRIVAVNREAMKDYDGVRVAGLFNGWFLHKPDSWPPSPKIKGAYIAFHATSGWRIDQAARDYLKANEPIGCRDMDTLRRLGDLGIEGYFSGCLTLTLNNPFGAEERTDRVMVVDFETDWHRAAHPKLTRLYERLVPAEVRRKAISFDQIRSKAGRYAGANRIGQSLEMLRLIATSKLVVTRRLHTALPCLALGTPFVFIHDEFHSDTRFEGFHEVLNGKGHDDDSAKIDWEAPRATDASALIRTVRDATRSAAAQMVELWNA